MREKGDISLINLISHVSLGARQRNRVISAEGANKHAETESDNEGEREDTCFFRLYPRPCHECENQGRTCKL